MLSDRPVPPHIVHVESDWACSSDSLAPAALRELEVTFRQVPWYRDRWSAKTLRAATSNLLRTSAAGGLILIGPRTKIDAPPPFEHLFEPIALGADDERLRTLSGEKPTRQERFKQFAIWVAASFGFLVFAAITSGLWFGFSRHVATILLALFTFVAVLVAIVKYAADYVRTWYLLPGSVAILRRLRRGRGRLTLLTRHNACAMLRYVYTGKVVMLMLELITLDGKREALPISDREAMSFLAAWRSPHPPPSREQLGELARS